MKILYISESIIPSKAASSVHVMKMCQALANQGHTVTLIATKGNENGDPFELYNVRKNFKLVLTPKMKILPKLSFLKRLFVGISYSKGVNLIYTRWLLPAIILIMMKKKNIIFEHHHFYSSWSNRMMEKKVINSKGVKRHIFITQNLKNDYCDKYPNLLKKDTLILPDGADISSAKLLNIDEEKQLHCGYIGSFLPGKGIEVILGIAERLPSIQFHIVGGSISEIEDINNNNNVKNIIWYGFLNQNEAMNVLETKIDIALLPNQNKVLVGKNKKLDIARWTSPMKLFEYMAKGKAIISSDLPVLQEILEHKKNALLVKPDIIDEWVDAIIELDNNRSLMNDIKFQAKFDLNSKYSWDIRSEKSLENLDYTASKK